MDPNQLHYIIDLIYLNATFFQFLYRSLGCVLDLLKKMKLNIVRVVLCESAFSIKARFITWEYFYLIKLSPNFWKICEKKFHSKRHSVSFFWNLFLCRLHFYISTHLTCYL